MTCPGSEWRLVSPESDHIGVPPGQKSANMYFLAIEIAATIALLIGHVAGIVHSRFLERHASPHFPAWRPVGAAPLRQTQVVLAATRGAA